MPLLLSLLYFFFNDPAPTEIYTLSLHDALPIYLLAVHQQQGLDHRAVERHLVALVVAEVDDQLVHPLLAQGLLGVPVDRKSTRLNSSHGYISYAVFCLKKKKKK